ncbi:putative O-methyltransferase YrrM [Actinomadura hallensis]|uniref:Putative O-methyltransferase YrrM n=1 Tax=Actinomadura hallensis TaxID=337895 RepID=A0A543IAZ4_9ACTN|nr:O-methyltransferase [Actinomadura hallensis]TQM67763.1 putative O-methyltransferase YrrM [Actinomadura hallensis]HLV75693.1 O-methyltransferase [Vulgatibacteraceae bacterium]
MEDYLPEDEALLNARRRGEDVGAAPIGAAAGAALRFLATAIGARTVVEVGSGCGVSGIWLMRGMPQDAVLTSVDIDPEHQRMAKQAYVEAGLGSFRTRMITGPALEVLPRLTDGAYDMVFCDAQKREYPDYLIDALRLLRPGGVVAFDNALWHDRVADPEHRDPDTEAIREVHRMIRDDERLVPMLLPVGDGLLCAVKRG